MYSEQSVAFCSVSTGVSGHETSYGNSGRIAQVFKGGEFKISKYITKVTVKRSIAKSLGHLTNDSSQDAYYRYPATPSKAMRR